MATFTIVANIEEGDETTSGANLFYKIYDSGTLYAVTGSSVSDSDVTLVGAVVTITNVALSPDTSYAFTLAQVDESHNESLISNVINVTSSGTGLSMFADGMYASGMYA